MAMKECPACKGTTKCAKCDGNGFLWDWGGLVKATCQLCKGKAVCNRCDGKGVVRRD
jgi:hypothetical protein